jgi:hypothetical protein
MRKTFHISAVVLLFLVAGCALSPRAEWAVARKGLTESENAIVLANQTGALPDKDLIALEPMAKAGQKALAEADAELTASHDQPTSRFRYYLNLASSAASKLSEFEKVKK